MSDYIPIDECKDGYLYRIHARNGIYGIYNEDNKSFTLSRHKWGNNYLFDEYHYDTGAPYGTVKPQEEVEDASHIEREDMLEYLNQHTDKTRTEENHGQPR